MRHGVTVAWLQLVTGCHRTTAQRWLKDGLPREVDLLARLMLHGELGLISELWHGFAMRRGKLVTPEDWEFSTGELRAVPFKYQLMAELERKLSEPQQWRLL